MLNEPKVFLVRSRFFMREVPHDKHTRVARIKSAGSGAYVRSTVESLPFTRLSKFFYWPIANFFITR